MEAVPRPLADPLIALAIFAQLKRGRLRWRATIEVLRGPSVYLASVEGHVAELVGIEGGVVSGVINLESSGV